MNLNQPCDKLIHAEVQMQNQDKMQLGKVLRRAMGPDGRTAGTHDDDPLRNSMICEVEFPDGQVKEHAANIIAENMLSQVDAEGFSKLLFDNTVDCEKSDAAVDKADRHLHTKMGKRRLKQTTVG